ncbi:ribonuclease H [Paenibacillus larvae subsp. larvae DSM 25430]|uniref:Ribonuclease H n=5 Tax=Paenibacillus larvae TaxID=1464 RepID=V9W709_9BACL|nr:ribonuclease H [Paenibacillus larvae subsp. larvae DSM 25430]PCK69520.1 hypothetical protein PL1_1141 [Paenibacillus larvae subsp. larvae B-3650]
MKNKGMRPAMAKNKTKYYVVWEGRIPGIYSTWTECQKQTQGYPQAKFKSYENEQEARAAFERGWKKSLDFSGKTKSAASASAEAAAEIDYDSVSVDVGCSGNPGIVEYKGVDTRTGEILFYHGPIAKGTNNLGEFLAIVHALAYLKQKGSNKTIYSDSRTALSWVKRKEISTNLVRDESTKEIWTLVDRALIWLKTNSYSNPLLKWDTKRWGEIKADFGRK